MDTVTATGTVREDGGRLVLIPTSPPGSEPLVELDLLGTDLPPAGARVAVEGGLDGRSLHTARWHPGPGTPSAWRVPAGIAGVSQDDADVITRSTPEEWSIIGLGRSTVPGGRGVVAVLEVERITPEIRAWYERQPPGSVHLVPSITPDTACTPDTA
ncbi:hypothetical protein [Geodermatophilus sp. URMC 63]